MEEQTDLNLLFTRWDFRLLSAASARKLPFTRTQLPTYRSLFKVAFFVCLVSSTAVAHSLPGGNGQSRLRREVEVEPRILLGDWLGSHTVTQTSFTSHHLRPTANTPGSPASNGLSITKAARITVPPVNAMWPETSTTRNSSPFNKRPTSPMRIIVPPPLETTPISDAPRPNDTHGIRERCTLKKMWILGRRRGVCGKKLFLVHGCRGKCFSSVMMTAADRSNPARTSHLYYHDSKCCKAKRTTVKRLVIPCDDGSDRQMFVLDALECSCQSN